AGRLAATEENADYAERQDEPDRRTEVDPLNPLLADEVLKRCQRQAVDFLGTCSSGREERDHNRTRTTDDAQEIVEILFGDLVCDQEEPRRADREHEPLAHT